MNTKKLIPEQSTYDEKRLRIANYFENISDELHDNLSDFYGTDFESIITHNPALLNARAALDKLRHAIKYLE